MKFIKDTNLRILAICAVFNTATLLAGGLIFTVTSAMADGSTATQSVLGSDLIMPYDGYLMIDSAPITGVRTIKFDLYQDATGGAVVWTETQTVNLYNGRFSVGLGSATSLTNTILDAEKLYLAMTVVETDAQGNTVDVELSGRQAIEPAPFAAWAGNSADFNVDGALDVANHAQVGSLGVTGAATVGTTLGVTGKGTFGSGEVTGEFRTQGFTELGNDTTSDYVQIRGFPSNGSQAALRIADGTTAMLLDGDGIDSGNTLRLNVDSGNSVQLGGSLTTGGSITMADDADIFDVDVINGFNDIRWRANSGDSSDDMKLTSSGHLEVYNNLEVDGNVTLGNNTSDTTTVKGNLSVEGNLQSWPQGNYCIMISTNDSGCNAQTGSGCDCPSGFNFSNLIIDVDGTNSSFGNPSPRTVNFTSPAGAIGIGMCCK